MKAVVTLAFLCCLLTSITSMAEDSTACSDQGAVNKSFYEKCKTVYIIDTGTVGKKGNNWCSCVANSFNLKLSAANEDCELSSGDVTSLVQNPPDNIKMKCGLNGIPHTRGNK